MRRGPSLRVCTAVARRDLAAADALSLSVAEHVPDAGLSVFVVDRDEPAVAGVDSREFRRLAAMYAPDALIGALKPSLLLKALDGCDIAVWLDAGLVLRGALTPLLEAAAKSAVALVPAVTSPPAGGPIAELEILSKGVYDSGLVAVSNEGATFLLWWGERLARHCIIDPVRGYWLDRRWLNVAPGYFGCAIVQGLLPLERTKQSAQVQPYGFDLADDVRVRYRGALLDAEQRGVPEPPNPLSDGVEALNSWLRPPAADSGGLPAKIDHPKSLESGVNLVLRHGEAPLDELGRTIAGELATLRVPVETIELIPGPVGSSLSGLDPRRAPHDTNLVCLNPLDLTSFAFHVEAGFFSLRRSIGVWLLEDMPAPDLNHVISFLDEVWVASDRARTALAKRTAKPVHVVPVPVTAARARDERHDFVTVASLGGPFSPGAAERANAIGVVRAYANAFAPADGASLLVRTTNGDRDIPALEELRLEVARRDVTVIDGPLLGNERRALIASARCYASLARSAELDLPALEAMVAGVPVVATGAGLPIDGFLRVPTTPVEIPPSLRTWWSDDEWLEPDLEEAARLLRSVPANPSPSPTRGNELNAFLVEHLAITGLRRRRGLRRLLRS